LRAFDSSDWKHPFSSMTDFKFESAASLVSQMDFQVAPDQSPFTMDAPSKTMNPAPRRAK